MTFRMSLRRRLRLLRGVSGGVVKTPRAPYEKEGDDLYFDEPLAWVSVDGDDLIFLEGAPVVVDGDELVVSE